MGTFRHLSRLLSNPNIAATVVSVYVLLYAATIPFDNMFVLSAVMFFLFPLPLGWMIFTILHDRHYQTRALGEQEEFGYQDRDTSTLDIF